MENDNEVIVDPNNEEVVEEVKEEINEEPTEVVEKPTETPEAKAARLLRQANQARKKLGLAPLGEVKEVKPEVKEQGMSNKDMLALVNAKVSEEDIGEVEDYANFKGISIAEALKAPMIKTLLAEREEFRKTAQATNSKATRKSPTKVSGEDLLERFNKTGEMPENDEDIVLLAKARTEAQRAKLRRN